MMNPIYIRVDGNEIIATGHVMRCLSIAEALRKLEIDVIFLVADECPCELIRNRGFSVEVLHTNWKNLNDEIEELCDYLKKNNAKVLLLDSYYVTSDYMNMLSKITSVVYIDDLNRFLYPVHTVIGYGKWVEKYNYVEEYSAHSMSTNFLLGCQYVPLREEFKYKRYKVQDEVSKVLITVGGTDSLNVTDNILQGVLKSRELNHLEYHVIVGCFNRNKENLKKLSMLHTNVILHENVTNMAEWMRECDVAISASGSTLFELCACGTPTICLEIADNQRGAEMWEQEGYMYYAGNAMSDMEQCVERCVEQLSIYKRNKKERINKSQKQQQLIDGLGAKRIAEYLVSI